MTFIHGKDTFISLNGSNLSTYTKSTDFTDTTDTHDVTTYGNSRKRYKAGLGDGTITIGGIHDDGVAGPRAIIKPLKAIGDPVQFIFRPEGTGGGKPQSIVNVVISSYKESDPVDDVITWEAELQMDGTLNEADQ
jgi:hypothetical protein